MNYAIYELYNHVWKIYERLTYAESCENLCWIMKIDEWMIANVSLAISCLQIQNGFCMFWEAG